MARIGVKGLVATDTTTITDVKTGRSAEVPSLPVLDWLLSQIQNAMNGQLDDKNLADGAVITAKIADAAVTNAKVLAGTLTPAVMADTVGQTYSATYTGDGTTANRVIAIPFTPRWVQIIPTTGTFTEYVAHGVGASSYYWARDNTGTIVTSASNFQGVVASGVKLGTNASGTANAAAVVYSLVAWK